MMEIEVNAAASDMVEGVVKKIPSTSYCEACPAGHSAGWLLNYFSGAFQIKVLLVMPSLLHSLRWQCCFGCGSHFVGNLMNVVVLVRSSES